MEVAILKEPESVERSVEGCTGKRTLFAVATARDEILAEDCWEQEETEPQSGIWKPWRRRAAHRVLNLEDLSAASGRKVQNLISALWELRVICIDVPEDLCAAEDDDSMTTTFCFTPAEVEADPEKFKRNLTLHAARHAVRIPMQQLVNCAKMAIIIKAAAAAAETMPELAARVDYLPDPAAAGLLKKTMDLLLGEWADVDVVREADDAAGEES